MFAVKDIGILGNRILSVRQPKMYKSLHRSIHFAQNKDDHIILSRYMLNADANTMGFLHGGINLQFTEKSGSVLCHRYLKDLGSKINNPTLCRIESTDFISPGIIGELLVAESKIDFVSQKSIRVCTDIGSWSRSGEKKLISKSILWYANCAQVSHGILSSCTVPQNEKYWKNVSAFEQYNTNKKNREINRKEDEDVDIPSSDFIFNSSSQQYSVARNSMCFHYTPSVIDCTSDGYLLGGSILKVIDETSAGIAMKYNRNPCVTVKAEAVNFYSPVTCGDVIRIYAFPIFTSMRTMEIRTIIVNTDAEKDNLVCSSTLIFASLNKDGSLNTFHPLQTESESERRLFEQRYNLYLQRKGVKNTKQN